MRIEWNNCFLCLNDLGTTGSSGNCSGNNVRLLLPYLVDCQPGNNQNNVGILEEVKLLFGSGEGPQMVRFCDSCAVQVERVKDLHMELEVVQIKLIHVLKSVRATARDCCKERGDMRLEIFEEWLKAEEAKVDLKEEAEKQRLSQQRRILESLYAFQKAVVFTPHGKSIDIPRVFLDQYLPHKPIVRGLEVKAPEPNYKTGTFSEDSDVCKKSRNNVAKLRAPRALYKNRETDKLPRKASSRVTSSRVPVPTNLITSRKTKPARKYSKKQVRLVVLPSFSTKPDSKGRFNFRPEVQYNCDTCTFSTQRPFSFEQHLRFHEASAGAPPNPQLRCDQCNRMFSCKQYHELHMAGHTGKYVLRCDICHAMFEPELIAGHMRTHQEKVFPCSQCSFCCSSREKLCDHFKYHTKCRLECDICGESFQLRSKLFHHYFRAHDAVRPQICGIDGCTKEFLDPILLSSHQNGQHSNTEHGCLVCGKAFPSATSLKKHLAIHASRKPFPCGQCDDSFSSKATLERHLVRDHGAPKHKCDLCHKTYTEKRTLQNHLLMAHAIGEGYPCELCGKVWPNRTLLRRHQLMHSDERNFVCEECGALFRHRNTWRRHTFTHGGEKKFKCQYCGKCFLFEKYLVIHTRIHTGERPYVCDICGKNFNQHASCSVHKRKVHGNERKGKSKKRQPRVDPDNSTNIACNDFTQQITSANLVDNFVNLFYGN